MSRALKMCFDRVLPKDLFRPQEAVPVGPPGTARAVIVFRKLWPNGTNLHVRFLGGDASQRAKAREQALWWTEFANLRFTFDDAPNAHIRIAFNPGDGAWSYIGTDCTQIPRDQPTMNLGFLDGGTAAHEFGHAIGLGHEHQNPQGGLVWNDEVVIRDLGGPPNFWTPEQVRHNVLDKYDKDQIRGSEFDPDSIMLYAFPSTWTKAGMGTHANDVLSALDKAFIASAQAYPRATSEVVDVPVGGAPVEGSIGKPGEEDMYRFKATAAGRHVIETNGSTDVFMKLFGPDRTTVIAEDDDSGIGLNARIATKLLPGEYFVQVRHFNLGGGTGAYSVRVRR
jgi:hypothetical protein